MLKPRINGICDECPFEEMIIEEFPLDEIYRCIHFPACVRVKNILDKQRKEDECEAK